MIKNKTKIIFTILFIVLWLNNTFAYTASDHKEINFNVTSSWTNVYTVPQWKDLIIYRLYSEESNAHLQISNDWINIDSSWYFTKNDIYDINITITDNLYVQDWSSWGNFTIFWYLVDEDEDIQYYINWNPSAWDKHIFNKEDIDYIYTIEMAFFVIVMIWRFYTITLTGTKWPFKI